MKNAALFPRHPKEHLERLIHLESKDLYAVLAFALASGLMALATPVAVQALVNTIAFGVLIQPLIVLMLMLFGCLALNSFLNGLQIYVVEMVQRRLFVRLVSQISTSLMESRIDHPLMKKGSDLANYYFEVMTVQKTWSNLLLDGLSYGLQTLIGLILLAFYHPALLGFDALIIASLYVIFRVLGKEGVKTAVAESEAKYAVASWLQELPRHPLATRFGNGRTWGLERSNALTVDYLECSEDHFKVLIRQQAAILGLYAVANTTLLGLGGWMVIERQLTLGQLVAAELIVSAMLAGLTRLGKTITSYYDLMAGMDKLSYLLDLPEDTQTLSPGDSAMILAGLKLNSVVIAPAEEGPTLTIPNLEISQAEKCVLLCPDRIVSANLTETISGLRQPISGSISINGIDTRILPISSLRNQSALIIDPEWFQVSILENFRVADAAIDVEQIQMALKIVGLEAFIRELPLGLNSKLMATGAPLGYEQLARLTLARALASRPRLLIIGPIIDSIGVLYLEDILNALFDENAPWTLILAMQDSHHIGETLLGRAKIIRLNPKEKLGR